MIKIGILGSDNSHAMEFSKLANLQHDGGFLYDDVRVTHIYGHNEEETARLQTLGGVQNIVKSPEELFGAVDAIMVVFRDGIYHKRYAMPFIEKGMPVWIDKPVTIEPKECEELLNAAKKHNAVISGGSNCKYAEDIKKISRFVAAPGKPVKTALLNFPIYLDSIYSGMHFYAAHLVEMAAEIFGFDILAVYSHINNENMNAILEYAGFDVHLCFSRGAKQYSCTLIGEESNDFFNIDISDIAPRGFAEFVNSVRTRKTAYPAQNLLKATVVVDALKRSAQENKRIIL